MTTINIKEGDFLITDNGLGSMTLVYLAKDENQTDFDGGAPMPGCFSAWFYNPEYGIDCADWALFSLKDYPKTSKCDTSTSDHFKRDPDVIKAIGFYLKETA